MNCHSPFSEEDVVKMSKEKYSNFIKTKIREASFLELRAQQEDSSKIKYINYIKQKNPQNYLISSNFTNEECSMLFNLRARCVNGIRTDFKKLYGN